MHCQHCHSSSVKPCFSWGFAEVLTWKQWLVWLPWTRVVVKDLEENGFRLIDLLVVEATGRRCVVLRCGTCTRTHAHTHTCSYSLFIEVCMCEENLSVWSYGKEPISPFFKDFINNAVMLLEGTRWVWALEKHWYTVPLLWGSNMHTRGFEGFLNCAL